MYLFSDVPTAKKVKKSGVPTSPYDNFHHTLPFSTLRLPLLLFSAVPDALDPRADLPQSLYK